MEELEELGLLKIDFLGLATLTIMRRACHLIRARHGLDLNLDTIPTDDPRAYELLSRGDVMGVFQVEGQGMRRVLMKMQPTEFEHIIATISLFRPGPMEYIDDYIDRLHGEKPIEYRHPALEPILRETFGIIVYQEQIISILADIAGYDPGDADLVRRAVGKKKKEDLLKHRASFIEGAMAHSDLPQEIAAGIFDDIEYFARYGFNKGHAADYAVLTCQTAYLKAHYPIEYMTALLNVERHNTEKVGQLIAECRRLHIEVLPPAINESDLDFSIQEHNRPEPAIRFGLAAVKNVGEGPVDAILAARKATGIFRDMDDFCRRVDLRQVNRRALESLIRAGALEAFGTRAQLLAVIDRLIGFSGNLHRARDVGQMSLFGEATGVRLPAEDAIFSALPPTPEVPRREILSWEKELVGVYLSEHPMQHVLSRLRDVVTTSLGDLSQEIHGQQVIVAGMVQRVRRHITKKGDEMAFVSIEDLDATSDVVVFPRVWSGTRELWQPERILVLSGKIDASRGDEPSLLCDWAKPPEAVILPSAAEAARMPAQPMSRRVDVQEPPPPMIAPDRVQARSRPEGEQVVRITLVRSGQQAQDVDRLRNIHSLLVDHPGHDRFVIQLVGGLNGAVELAFPNDRTSCTPELVKQLAVMVGATGVRVERKESLSDGR
jgi:DNA polymerase-3 subunit alpha